jgi:hypothetical protein
VISQIEVIESPVESLAISRFCVNNDCLLQIEVHKLIEHVLQIPLEQDFEKNTDDFDELQHPTKKTGSD